MVVAGARCRTAEGGGYGELTATEELGKEGKDRDVQRIRQLTLDSCGGSERTGKPGINGGGAGMFRPESGKTRMVRPI